MSRTPHPDGVAEVVKLLADVDALAAEAAHLRPMAQRLEEVEAQLAALRTRLPELLRSMDVEAPGNFGWERRMGWFLAEIRRQLQEAAEAHARKGNEVLAEHERTCVARIKELEAAMHTAGENVMRLTQEAEALRLELSQAQADAAAMRAKAEYEEVTSLLSLVDVELHAWEASGRNDDGKGGAVEALRDLRSLVARRREVKLAALDAKGTP